MVRWSEDDDLYLLTPDEFNQLPDGISLTCIDGTVLVKGKDDFDQDTRYGHIAYGVNDPWHHQLKDKFLIFELVR